MHFGRKITRATAFAQLGFNVLKKGLENIPVSP